nr:hypothetical protein [Tanacetum cinerariifolium]
MDSMILNGQKNTLAEYMILFGAHNHPPMLHKDFYDSWKSKMELYMQNRENGRMILKSVEHVPLIWPTIKENRVTKTKNLLNCLLQRKSNLIVISRELISFFKFRDKVLLVEAQGKGKVLNEEELEFLADLGIAEGPVTQSVITHTVTYQADDLDAYDSDCDEISTAKAVLMTNFSSYGSYVISEKVQLIRPMLYDGSVIAKDTNVISIVDYEETLMLEKENFGKRFVPQQELFDEQDFWLQTSHPNTDQSASLLVKIEAPQELPKIRITLSQRRINLSQILIDFGDSYQAPPEETGKGSASESFAKKKGRTVAITTEDMQKRRNEAEGSETLEQTFNRLQAIVSHLEFMDVEIEQDDLNQKFLTSLVPEWLMYIIVWRNRDDLDTMSLDDVYNHIKVYEPEVQKKSETNSQNMAFISSSNTSSGKGEVHTASVSTASTQVSTASTDVTAASISHDTTGKKITIQGSGVAGFDKFKVECFNFHKMGHFVRECRAPRNQDRGKRESYRQGPKEEEQAPKALMAIDGIGWDWNYMANEEENHALVADEEVPMEFALMAKSSSSSKNEVYDDSFCSKSCRKNTENLNTKITKLNKELSDIIDFGDSYQAPPEETGKGSASESFAKKKGRTVAITTEDMQKRRNNVKARTTLLLALPDEHYGKGEVHTASVPTASTQVSTASTDVTTASISHDTTGKKITIQGSDVAGFDKFKVECFNYQKMGHFARECRAPRSQDRGKRESYRQGPKEEEQAPKALMAIDGIGWDWSYMANEEENHALVADEEVPIEFALMAKSSSSSKNEVYDDSFCSKSCRKNTENLNTKITKLNEELSDTTDSPKVVKTNKTKTARKSPVKYAEMYRSTSKTPKVRGNQRNWNNLKSQ